MAAVNDPEVFVDVGRIVEWIRSNVRHGEMKACFLELAAVALPQAKSNRAEITLHEIARDKSHPRRACRISVSKLRGLARKIGVTDEEKFSSHVVLRTAGEALEHQPFPPGPGGIQVLERGANLLEPPDEPDRYAPVNSFVAVHVDRVEFLTVDATGASRPRPGRYIRIDVPDRQKRGNGAVVLAVDKASGDVLLVVSYRYAPDRFMTEAIRGFGLLGFDQDERDTAIRETPEEGGVVVIRNERGEFELTRLRSLYTDTGKLCEAPHYFLALVDRDTFDPGHRRPDVTLEVPVWVRWPAFLAAVQSGAPIRHGDAGWTTAMSPQVVEVFASGLLHRKEDLYVEDAFTCLVGFLAEQKLHAMFPRQLLPPS